MPEKESNQGSKNSKLIAFSIGEREFAVPIEQINEVVITPPITPMPLMPSYVLGLANVRGQVLAMVDLSIRFGLTTQPADQGQRTYTLVVEHEQLKMGLLVKDVPITLNVNAQMLDNQPALLKHQKEQAKYISSVIKIGEERLILMIDLFKLVSTEDIITNFDH